MQLQLGCAHFFVSAMELPPDADSLTACEGKMQLLHGEVTLRDQIFNSFGEPLLIGAWISSFVSRCSKMVGARSRPNKSALNEYAVTLCYQVLF